MIRTVGSAMRGSMVDKSHRSSHRIRHRIGRTSPSRGRNFEDRIEPVRRWEQGWVAPVSAPILQIVAVECSASPRPDRKIQNPAHAAHDADGSQQMQYHALPEDHAGDAPGVGRGDRIGREMVLGHGHAISSPCTDGQYPGPRTACGQSNPVRSFPAWRKQVQLMTNAVAGPE